MLFQAASLEANNCKRKVAVNLDNDDLGVIVNGYPDDKIDDKPFDKCFTKEIVLKGWGRVGYCPFTREALKNPKLRLELGQTKPAENIENLQKTYNDLAEKAVERGYNPVFDKTVPVAAKVKRKETSEEQVQELVKKGKAFSVSGMWQTMGTMVANSEAILRAQELSLEIDKKRKAASQAKKAKEVENRFEKAKAAMEKEKRGEKLNAKNWKDIIMYVLPAAGEKDPPSKFTTVVTIKERLAKLGNSWQEYLQPKSNAEEEKEIDI